MCTQLLAHAPSALSEKPVSQAAQRLSPCVRHSLPSATAVPFSHGHWFVSHCPLTRCVPSPQDAHLSAPCVGQSTPVAGVLPSPAQKHVLRMQEEPSTCWPAGHEQRSASDVQPAFTLLPAGHASTLPRSALSCAFSVFRSATVAASEEPVVALLLIVMSRSHEDLRTPPTFSSVQLPSLSLNCACMRAGEG